MLEPFDVAGGSFPKAQWRLAGFGQIEPVAPRVSTGLRNIIFGLLARYAFGFTPDDAVDAPARRVFREAFARVGLPFSKPHTARNTLVQYAYQKGGSAEQMKALAQNLGHESPLTTFGSYGPLTVERQGEVIAGVGRKEGGVDLSQSTPADLLRALTAKLGAI